MKKGRHHEDEDQETRECSRPEAPKNLRYRETYSQVRMIVLYVVRQIIIGLC
jgi:hypothetical protein